jgi:Zn-dependent M16 (insulinase) family peptidase
LQQEGWHYELESLDDPLTFKGVVYNEMKGAYSSPDNLLYRQSRRSLFPDTAYGLDSGGDPAEIPNLTYEQFRAFHETYYHPSNARIFFYGDDDPEERLRYLDTWLSEYDRIEVTSSIPLQPPFETPRHETIPYDAGEAGEDGSDAKKGMLTVNWLLGAAGDPELSLGLGILEHILVGTPASPLRKALIDSGLGEDLAGGGLNDSMRQMIFSTGLKGIAVDDADKGGRRCRQGANPDRGDLGGTGYRGHRLGDDRGLSQHRRVPTAREQLRRLSPRAGAGPLYRHECLVARRRSIGLPGL